MTHPRVTIIVAIRNVAADLKTTLDNFSAQSFTDFEVIIADCNSVDDPSQYLKNRSFPIRHVVQSDTGIYDAWNKVLPLAQGEWVNFMGAGDHFATDQTLTQAVEILDTLPQDTLMAYGKVNVIGENCKIVRQSGADWPNSLDQIKRFDMFPHQATFQRVSTFAKYGLFDCSYRIAGDTDMILRLAHLRVPVHFPLIVANFRYGGTSSAPNRRLESVREGARIMKKHGIANSAVNAFAKATVLELMYRLLPQKTLHRVIDFYRQLTNRSPRFR